MDQKTEPVLSQPLCNTHLRLHLDMDGFSDPTTWSRNFDDEEIDEEEVVELPKVEFVVRFCFSHFRATSKLGEHINLVLTIVYALCCYREDSSQLKANWRPQRAS